MVAQSVSLKSAGEGAKWHRLQVSAHNCAPDFSIVSSSFPSGISVYVSFEEEQELIEALRVAKMNKPTIILYTVFIPPYLDIYFKILSPIEEKSHRYS